MAYKLAPCGGIKLDETNFTIDEDGTIKVIGGSSGASDYNDGDCAASASAGAEFNGS